MFSVTVMTGPGRGLLAAAGIWPGIAATVVAVVLGIFLMRGQLRWRRVNRELEQELQRRRKAQEELARKLEGEREVGDLKTRFITMVSHEFRTPLGIIMSAVELLRGYHDRLPEAKRRELLDDIHGSTRQMASIMEQVLLLGRVDAGKAALRSTSIDLPTLLGKITDEMLSTTVRRCPIRLGIEGSMAGAAGDESVLRHILTNLLSNASKYSPEGATVEFAVARDGTRAVFTISDRGIGIPEADQKRLFDAFHRASNVGEIPGTGLGLLIVKRCVELHGGEITFTSVPGRGTTFTVRLPLFG
jgi:signal transduction histidine kinase